MTSQQLDEERIFHLAREIPGQSARSEYLNQVCAGDQALRERVEELLRIHEQEQSFLKSSGGPPPTEAMSALNITSGQQIGRYKLMEQIGEGGMGTVFVAQQDRPIRRKVALKVIKPGMDTKAVIARFEAERQALALMDHPNIAKVLDAGTTESGRPFFAMELVKGVPITEYCDRNRLSIKERLELFIQVCHAIQHAHQKGIIHRDIKPSNVLVTLHDGKPVPKVIDFGVAKAISARLTDKTIYTEHLQIVGTLLYMSPEQAELSGLDIDTRSDIYSLGVLLYELLTGTTPFQKDDLDKAGFDEQRRIIRDQEPPRASVRISSLGATVATVAEQRQTDPNRLHDWVAGDLDWVIHQTLEKDRTRRYDSATSLAKDVGRFLEGKPVEAHPPSIHYRCLKYVRRNKLGIATAIAITFSLIIGTGTATWQAVVANQALQKVQDEFFFRQVETLLSGMEMQESTTELKEILEEWQVEVLLGIEAHNHVNWNQALLHFEKAESLNDSLAIQGLKLHVLLLAGESDRYEQGISSLLEGRDPQEYLDRLFVGNALAFRDAPKALELVETAIEMRNSLYAQKVLAEIHQAIAYDTNDIEHAEKCLALADAVCTLAPDNENFVGMLLTAQLTSMQFRQLLDEDTTELSKQARVNALRVGRQTEFAMAQYLAGSFHTLMGEHDRAADYYDEAINKGKGFHFVAAGASHLRLGEIEPAIKLLRNGSEHSPYNRITLAEALAVTRVNVDEAIDIYQREKHKRPPSKSARTIWTIPESVLLAARDLPRAQTDATQRLREQEGQLSNWEIAQLNFIIEDTSESSIAKLITSVDSTERRSTPQRMRAYKLIGLKYLADKKIDKATQYLTLAERGTVCSTWPTALWSGALNSIVRQGTR